MQKKEKVRPKRQEPRKNTSKEKDHQEVPQAQQEKAEKKEQSHQFKLYDLLEVEKDATSDIIKKQYRKLVLKYHPDKNPDDPSAKQKFQRLKQAYDILIDSQKRQEYDETGKVGEQFNESNFQAAYNYFRTMYKKISKEDIQAFEVRYRNGPEEEEDLLDYYNKHKGSMCALLESIPLSTNDDVPRFIEFYEKRIASKEIKGYKQFEKTKNKVRPLENEEEEYQKQKQKGLGALVLAIKNKDKTKQDFITNLQEKYGAGKKKKIEKPEKKHEKERTPKKK